MKVTIDIPKEFEDHWKDDRFEDSLSRLKADAHCLAGNYEKETMSMLIKAFNNATDAVEVVRCKNCIHSHTDKDDDEDVYHCELTPGRAWHHGHFCSSGEGREDVRKSD